MQKYNPINILLNSYKNYLQLDYKQSFVLNDTKSLNSKLDAFIKSILVLMKLKGYSGYNIKVSDNGISIFKYHTLIVTYPTKFLFNIKNESSLKFHLLIEWGNLIEFENKKENALIAL